VLYEERLFQQAMVLQHYSWHPPTGNKPLMAIIEKIEIKESNIYYLFFFIIPVMGAPLNYACFSGLTKMAISLM
jgi:hypothetical protein